MTLTKEIFQKRKDQLLFSTKKKVRKTKQQIYSSGLIRFSGPCLNKGINIPTRLKEWFYFPENKGESLKVRCDYKIQISDKNKKQYKNVVSIIKHNGHSCNLKPIKQQEKIEIINWTFKNKRILHCELSQTLNGKSQLQLKPQFHLANNIIQQLDFKSKLKLKPLISYDYKTKKVSIYQDDYKSIFIKVTGQLDKYSSFYINNHVGQFINDWFKTEEHCYAVLKGKEPIIVPSKIQKRKERGGRVGKTLTFPYYEEEQEVEVVFTSPNYTLTNAALVNQRIRTKLLDKGEIPIKGLLANVWQTEQHQNKDFAFEVRYLLQNYTQKNIDFIFVSEVILEADHKNLINPKGCKHCFDFLIMDDSKAIPSIFLIETISKVGKGKNRIITQEVAQLSHYKSLLGNNYQTILFINEDFKSKQQELITDYYSLLTDTLIIGSEILTHCITSPNNFTDILTTYQTKRAQLSKCSDNVVHPITTEIIQIRQLHEEAFTLISEIAQTRLNDELITHYCNLMSIAKKDFYYLFKKGKQLKNQKLTINYLSQLPYSENQNNKLTHKNTLAVFYIHKKLISDQSVALLSVKPELSSLLAYKELLEKTLPAHLKITGVLKTNHKGKHFENTVSQILEEEGYFTLQNVIFSFPRKTFEIDILAIKNNSLLFVSCKDHSTINRKMDAEKFLKIAANCLELNCKLSQISTARLYFKANPSYSNELIDNYNNTYWGSNIQLILME